MYGYHKNPSTGGWEVLIGWKGLPAHDATWEFIDDFQQQFPTFQLEDKVNLEGGGNVRTPIVYQYQRRGRGRMGKTFVKGGDHEN